MRTQKLGRTNLQVPVIGLGCMRIPGLGDVKEVDSLIETALEYGVNFFDHADIYGGGEAEALFGKAMNHSKREQMILQSKCAIRPGVAYDFSKEYILESVDSILKRLQTEYLDILLLHRPDTLMEPEEVAEAFDQLEKAGKVRYFGVSNQNSMQMKLLNKYCGNKIMVDQLQFSIVHCDIIDSGINVNVHNDAGANRDGSVLEYCRLKDITIQAWSPFQYGMFEGVFLNNEKFPELNQKINELAEKYHVTNNAIAVAWILRHPAKIQTIVGTTNKERLTQICQATDVMLTRAEWYKLYMLAGKQLP